MGQRSPLELAFLCRLRQLAPELAAGLVEEHAFAAAELGRRWRFDFCWPERLVAVELDGGQWRAGGGRHNGDGDRWKRAAAAALGWRVLAFSGQQLAEDPARCFALLRRALALTPGVYPLVHPSVPAPAPALPAPGER